MALLCTSLSTSHTHTEQQQKEFRLCSQKMLSLSQIQILALPLTNCVKSAEFLTSMSSYFLMHKTTPIPSSQGCYKGSALSTWNVLGMFQSN